MQAKLHQGSEIEVMLEKAGKLLATQKYSHLLWN